MNATRNFAKIALCSALALGAAGTVSSVFADEMPAKSDQPVTDTWITTKVKSELATTEGVKSTKISVTTKDGTPRSRRTRSKSASTEAPSVASQAIAVAPVPRATSAIFAGSREATATFMPSAAAIFWPFRTTSPGLTMALAGAPMCWESGSTSSSGMPAGAMLPPTD